MASKRNNFKKITLQRNHFEDKQLQKVLARHFTGLVFITMTGMGVRTGGQEGGLPPPFPGPPWPAKIVCISTFLVGNSMF